MDFKSIKLDGRDIQLARRLIRVSFALYCMFIGYRFYMFYLWASGRSEVMVLRPASVEAFLPISALASLKVWLLSGDFDKIHPAGLSILLIIMVSAFLLRKSFCGWICPVGLLSGLLEFSGRRLNLALCPPVWLDYPLRSLKYLLLSFFVYMIFWQMDVHTIVKFLTSPYNLTADARMLLFFLNPSLLVLSVLGVLAGLSVLTRNFWCKYLCPYGALLGIISLFSPVRVRRKVELCIGCKKCSRACPACIKVFEKQEVRGAECYGCLKCISSCPVDGCLELGLPAKKRMPLWMMPLFVLFLFIGGWIVAELTGHWESSVSAEMFRRIYSMLGI